MKTKPLIIGSLAAAVLALSVPARAEDTPQPDPAGATAADANAAAPEQPVKNLQHNTAGGDGYAAANRQGENPLNGSDAGYEALVARIQQLEARIDRMQTMLDRVTGPGAMR